MQTVQIRVRFLFQAAAHKGKLTAVLRQEITSSLPPPSQRRPLVLCSAPIEEPLSRLPRKTMSNAESFNLFLQLWFCYTNTKKRKKDISLEFNGSEQSLLKVGEDTARLMWDTRKSTRRRERGRGRRERRGAKSLFFFHFYLAGAASTTC